MPDPFFRRLKKEDAVASGPDQREVPRNELENRPFVVLKCVLCGKDIARSAEAGSAWVHMADEVIIGQRIEINFQDHQARPAYIDTTGREA